MDGWKDYLGRKVFVILRNGRNYQGEVLNVDDTMKPLVFITILDKFDNRIKFVNSEVELLQEEK